MISVYKDGGLQLAEAVFNQLLTRTAYGSESLPRNGKIRVATATLGGYSAYRFDYAEEQESFHFKPVVRWAWVKQNSVTDGIDVTLANIDQVYYDEKRGHVPLDTAHQAELFENEISLAAQGIYDFLVNGAITVYHTYRKIPAP